MPGGVRSECSGDPPKNALVSVTKVYDVPQFLLAALSGSYVVASLLPLIAVVFLAYLPIGVALTCCSMCTKAWA
jgi:hypothetical protein